MHKYMHMYLQRVMYVCSLHCGNQSWHQMSSSITSPPSFFFLFFFLFFFFEISPSLEFPDSAKLTSQGSFCFCYPPVLVLQAHTEGAWSIPHLVLFLVWVWVFICVHKWAFNDKCTCGCENVKSRGQGPEYSLIIPHLSFQVGVSH